MDLIISDIHADILALNSILDLVSSKDFKQKYGQISRIINLGDVLERGTNPKQVLQKFMDLSKNYPIISVMGNHDEAFLYKRKVSGNSWESIAAHDSLVDRDLEFFKKNKDETFGQQDFVEKKSRIVCVHGGPLDPKKITPKDANLDAWFYQKSWQRLSEEGEYLSPYGYFYSPSSAFLETKSKIDNPIILSGHEHLEVAIKQDKDGIQDILFKHKPKTEKLSKFSVEKREIPIESDSSYLIKVGLGGPEGYYGTGEARPHFGIIQDDPKKIILFGIKPE